MNNNPKLLSTEEAKALYECAHDPDGWALFREAETILGKFSCAAFAYEDNRGEFEEADGYDLLPYLLVQYSFLLGESNAIADRWQIVCPGYEQCANFDIDETTPEYQEFENKLYNGALLRLHLTKCDVCHLDDARIVITIRDGSGERHMCPNCIAQNIGVMRFVNDPALVDDITGKYGAVQFDACGERYVLEAASMDRLLRYDLLPYEWKALTTKYRSTQFMLHGDFYDDEGNALQPMRR